MQLKFLYLSLFVGCLLVPSITVSAGLNSKGDTPTKEQVKLNGDQAIKSMAKHHRARTDWSKELGLTKEQQFQVQQIYDNDQPQIEELIEQMKNAQQKIADIYKAEDVAIRNILNEQQQIKFDKIVIKHKKMRGEKVEGKKPSRKRMRQY